MEVFASLKKRAEVVYCPTYFSFRLFCFLNKLSKIWWSAVFCVAIISYFSSFLFKQKMMCGFLWEVDIETHLFCSGRRIACDDDLITMIWRMLYVRVCVCVCVCVCLYNQLACGDMMCFTNKIIVIISLIYSREYDTICDAMLFIN